MIDIDDFRRPDGSIKLVEAYKELHKDDFATKLGIKYLELIEEYQPIFSKPLAIVTFATADMFALTRP
jgi:hypothetical protein